MKKVLVSLIISYLLSGCASYIWEDDVIETVQKVETVQDVEPGEEVEIVKSAPSLLMGNVEIDGFSNTNNHAMWQQVASKETIPNRNINHYVRGIMQGLLSNLQYVGAATPIAVADFVYLGSDYNSSDIVGRQIAEAFSHEVHKLGIPIVDYKLTDYIRVTPDGDFALSKDYLELSGDLPIRYILTGTMVKDRNTTIVNARIVGVKSKAIVASAQGVIPRTITNDLSTILSNDGLIR